MRLKSLQVKNYKTIEDSGRSEIDKNVTCLLGKNESGKSAVLQALWKFNNVANAKYDKLFDLPAETFTRLRGTDPEVTVLEFILDEEDKKAFLANFKTLSSAPDTITIHGTFDAKRAYKVQLAYSPAKYQTIAPTVDKALEVLSVLEQTATATEAQTQIGNAITALELLKSTGSPDKTAEEIGSEAIKGALTAVHAVSAAKLGAIAKPTTDALTRFTAHSEMAGLQKKVEDWIAKRLPVFIYFEDYGRLKTRINLTEFLAKREQYKNGTLKDSEEQMLLRTQMALFEWANLDAAELQKLGLPKQTGETQETVDRRKAERARIMESASYHLTGDWVDWWDQRIHTLHITADGDELELRVSDDVNPWQIAFGERSRGFQWFFSFYLTFLVESSKAHEGAIILLDEPGLHLHPKAQLKLLSFFQKISGKNQLIYSSHSMFMVDHNYYDNVRTVYLKPKHPEQPKSRAYTRVSAGSEPEGDAETLLPLQGAGAYLLAQTIFLGKRTLIVEGISDYWTINVLSNYVSENGGGGLNEDTVVIWAGGTSNMMPLASVMSSGEQMGPNRMAVLVDSDKAGLEKAKRLIELLAHGQDSVLLLGSILGIQRAEIEDIPDVDELLAGLKSIGRVPAGAVAKNANETNAEFLRRIYTENGWGELKKEVKAKIVLHTTNLWRDGGNSPKSETLKRARTLFAAINTAFDKLHAKQATPLTAAAP